MSDPEAPELQDKPDDVQSAPDEGQAPTQDWEKQYQELRSEYNRRDSEIAELRQLRDGLTNPETQAEVLQALGYEIPEDEPQQPEYGDPYEQQLAQLSQQVEQLERAQQQQAEFEQYQQQEQQTATYVGGAVQQIEQQLGREFSDQELTFLTALAYQNPDQNGLPNVQGAWEAVQGFEQSAQQRWVKTKRSPGVPDGQSASKQHDLSTPEGRAAYAEQRLDALEDDNVLT